MPYIVIHAYAQGKKRRRGVVGKGEKAATTVANNNFIIG